MGAEPIKILHIDTGRTWRGGQQQALYLAQLLLNEKIETGMVCPPGSEMQYRAEASGIPVYSIPMSGELDFIAAFRIAMLCRTQQYRIVQLHTAHAHALGLWIKLFFRNIRLISVRRVDFHIRSVWKYNHSWIDQIVCISDAIKNVMLQDRMDENRLVTIHSGIDLNRFAEVKPDSDLRQSFRIPEDHLIIGTVAAVAGHKDYPNLLRAAEIVIRNFKKVSFMAVGDGPDEAAIHALAGSLKLEDRFHFVGFQKEIGDYLNLFDIFVLASKKEGLGTSILDALALGLPVVACESGGIPEIIQQNENGLLVPSKDPDALAEGCLQLLQDRALRKQFSSHARVSIEKFDMRVMAKKYMTLYQNLLAGSNE